MKSTIQKKTTSIKSKKKVKMNSIKNNNETNKNKNENKTNKIENKNKNKIENKNKNKNKNKNENKTNKINKNKNENKTNKINKNKNGEMKDEFMKMEEIFTKKSGKIDFDKILDECLKNRDIFVTMNKNEKKKLNEEYETSFQEIDSFRKTLMKKDIEEIDTIVYHTENNDGVFSAVSAYHYYTTTYPNRAESIQVIPVKPRSGVNYVNTRNQEKYKGKNILILDLDFSQEYIKSLQSLCNNLIVIDDHLQKNALHGEKIFVGSNHSACANTFKFFYPNEKIPDVIKMIDISDSKIGLGEYSNYMNHFTKFLGHRYTHNKTLMKDPKRLITELWNFIYDINMNTALFIGHYMDEAENSLKDQIAINAKPIKFQGYNCAVINFNSPSLTKPVLRQVNTNYERMGNPIDFAISWGYEYTSGAYSVTLMDNHRPESTINLKDIAYKLARIGGHPKGGGGHAPHIGHFYWPRNQKMDIWDLFTKKYL
jgi:hypothetical protein